jgi:hypothetical protein
METLASQGTSDSAHERHRLESHIPPADFKRRASKEGVVAGPADLATR